MHVYTHPTSLVIPSEDLPPQFPSQEKSRLFDTDDLFRSAQLLPALEMSLTSDVQNQHPANEY